MADPETRPRPQCHSAVNHAPENTIGVDEEGTRNVAMFAQSNGVTISNSVIYTVNGTFRSAVNGANHPQQNTESPHGSENISADSIFHTTPSRRHGSPLNSDHDPYNASNHERRTSPKIPKLRKSFKVKNDVELYSSLDDNNSRGVALHIPQPDIRLSPAARREGVSIGTVGWVTPQRSFDSILNICRSTCDPVNPTDLHLSNVTAGFQPHITEFKQFNECGVVSTPGIYSLPVAGSSESESRFNRTIASFGIGDQQEGALLVLPQGAYLQQLRNKEQFIDSFMEQAPALYAYLNNTQGLRIANGELWIIHSCHKSSSWAIATFQNTSEIPIQMDLMEYANPGLRSAGSRYAMNCQGTVHSKVGPKDDNDDLEEDGRPISSLRNQTVFVQTTRIKLSDDVWQQTFPVSVGSYDRNTSQNSSPRPSTLPFFSPTSSPLLSPTSSPPLSPSSQLSEFPEWPEASGNLYTPPTSISGYDSDGDISAASDEDSVDLSGVSHVKSQWASDTVTDYLLEMRPGAKAAISSDRDWSLCSSLYQSQSRLLGEICEKNDICERNGLVYLEPKENFLSENDRRLIVESLGGMTGRESLQVYLFGHKQSREERCIMLTGLIRHLQDCAGHDPMLQEHQKSQPMPLDGHPIRNLSLDYVLQAMGQDQPSSPLQSIPNLRAALSVAELLEPDIIKAVHGQRLAESLLRRYCFLGHSDDLHEAIWVFFGALALTAATSYRRLEIYLDLGAALFLRYQLFQQNDDLVELLSVLQHEKEALQSTPYSWIWDGIHALPLISSHSNVIRECMVRQELNGQDGAQDEEPIHTIFGTCDSAPDTDHTKDPIDNTNNVGGASAQLSPYLSFTLSPQLESLFATTEYDYSLQAFEPHTVKLADTERRRHYDSDSYTSPSEDEERTSKPSWPVRRYTPPTSIHGPSSLSSFKIPPVFSETSRHILNKALLMGIHKFSEIALQGPHADVSAIYDLLIDRYGYNSSEITVLIGNDDPAHVQPTKALTLPQIAALVRDARAGDEFFFHSTGHGAQKESRPEVYDKDKKNEYITTSNEQCITDDELQEHPVKPLTSDCKLKADFDCIHSGSSLGRNTSQSGSDDSNYALCAETRKTEADGRNENILTLPSVVEYQGLVGMEFWQAPFDFFDRLPYPQSLSDVHEITHQSSEQFIAESQKTLLAIRHLKFEDGKKLSRSLISKIGLYADKFPPGDYALIYEGDLSHILAEIEPEGQVTGTHCRVRGSSETPANAEMASGGTSLISENPGSLPAPSILPNISTAFQAIPQARVTATPSRDHTAVRAPGSRTPRKSGTNRAAPLAPHLNRFHTQLTTVPLGPPALGSGGRSPLQAVSASAVDPSDSITERNPSSRKLREYSRSSTRPTTGMMAGESTRAAGMTALAAPSASRDMGQALDHDVADEGSSARPTWLSSVTVSTTSAGTSRPAVRAQRKRVSGAGERMEPEAKAVA